MPTSYERQSGGVLVNSVFTGAQGRSRARKLSTGFVAEWPDDSAAAADTAGAALGSMRMGVGVEDDMAAGGGGAQGTMLTQAIVTAAANEPPQSGNPTFVINEDQVLPLSQLLTFSDPDGNGIGGFELLSITGGRILLGGGAIGTGIVWTPANLEVMTFVPDQDLNGAGAASFTYRIYDNSGSATGNSAVGSATFNITAVNDAPVITKLPGDIVAYIEGFGPVKIDAGEALRLTDVDFVPSDELFFTLRATNPHPNDRFDIFSNPHDRLEVLDSAGGRIILIDGVYVGGVFSYGPNANELTILLEFNPPLASIQTVLRNLAYWNSSVDDPAPGTRILELSLPDGQGATTVVNTSVIVIPVNDAPTIELAAASFNAGESTVNELPRRVTTGSFSDPDWHGGTMTVSSGLAEDVLTLVSSGPIVVSGSSILVGGVVIGTFVEGTGGNPLVITFNAASTSIAVQRTIGAVSYQNVSEAPTPGRTLTYTVTDGGGASTSSQVTVNVIPENDPPSGTDGVAAASEDVPLTLTVANFGYSDDDAALAAVRFSGVSGGSLLLDHDGNSATEAVAVGSGTSVSAADIALGRLTFLPGANLSGTGAAKIGFFVMSEGGSPNIDLSVNTLTIDIAAVDDAPVAAPDTGATDEASTIVITVLGNDGDIDGPAPAVAEIGGTAVTVGQIVTLTSGATARLNADGTITYDPNGKYNSLTSTSGGQSGAVNTSAVDTFTYKLAGGTAAANVAVTVNGLASSQDVLAGDGSDNAITGTARADFFLLQQGGDDKAFGLGGNDNFYIGGAMTPDDGIDGGAGSDTLALQGNYAALTLGAGVVGLELIALMPGDDTRFGVSGSSFYDYDIETVDENVAAGTQLKIDAGRLRVGEDFTFDGSAETNGFFRIAGGFGVENLTGGAKDDAFLFFAGSFGASDKVDGGGGNDQLALRGDYSITIGEGQFTSIETLVMQSGRDIRENVDYQYDVTMSDGNVAAGQRLGVDAAQLRAGERLTFDGSAETDGFFRVAGGGGDDAITGGAGNDIIEGRGRGDILTGGGGNDIFLYRSADHSNGTEQDSIQDFSPGDLIDLSHIDADTNTAENEAFTFIGSAAFSGTAGELRFENMSSASAWKIQGDIDGNGIADLEIVLVIDTPDPITASDFIL
jgi:hypothetical protein